MIRGQTISVLITNSNPDRQTHKTHLSWQCPRMLKLRPSINLLIYYRRLPASLTASLNTSLQLRQYCQWLSYLSTQKLCCQLYIFLGQRKFYLEDSNKIGKVQATFRRTLTYPKVFFTPHRAGHCCACSRSLYCDSISLLCNNVLQQ
jgi:hypothetical protein